MEINRKEGPSTRQALFFLHQNLDISVCITAPFIKASHFSCCFLGKKPPNKNMAAKMKLITAQIFRSA